MISAQGQKGPQERLIHDLMALPNQAWDNIIAQANQNPACLQDGDVIKIVGNIMKTNVAACSSIGSYFYPQIGRIYFDMLTMYRASSQLIDEAVQREGKDFPFCRSGNDELMTFRQYRNEDAKGPRATHYQKRDPQAHQYLR
jgi:hypothetical protein